MKSGLSVIIPVFNEASALSKTVEELNKIFQDIHFPIEVIFVNDGSTDGSIDFLNSMSLKQCRVISHAYNRGYGLLLKLVSKKPRLTLSQLQMPTVLTRFRDYPNFMKQ